MDEEAVKRVVDWFHKVRANDNYDHFLAEFKIGDAINSLRQFVMNSAVIPGRPWVQKNPRDGAIKVGDFYFVPCVHLKLGSYEVAVHSVDQLDSINGGIPVVFIDLARIYGWNASHIPSFDGEPNPFYAAVSSAPYFGDRLGETKNLVEREIYRQTLDAEDLVSAYDRTLGDEQILNVKPDLKETLEACKGLRNQTPDFITKLLRLGEEELQQVLSLMKRRQNEITVLHTDVVQEVLDQVLIQDIMSQ